MTANDVNCNEITSRCKMIEDVDAIQLIFKIRELAKRNDASLAIIQHSSNY